MTIIKVNTEPEVIRKVASYVEKIANDAIFNRGKFLVGVSGGSVVKYLSEGLPKIKTEWSKWTVAFCDERVVPEDNEDSTFGAYKKQLIPKTSLKENQFIVIKQGVSAKEAAEDYNQKLKKIFNSDNYKFDLLILGMGPDGHTCSLFPGHPLLNETSLKVAAISDSPKQPPERITLTYPVINNSRNCMFAISGVGKAEMLKRQNMVWGVEYYLQLQKRWNNLPQTHNENVAQERNKENNDGNQNSSHLSTETEEGSHNIQQENGTRSKENKSSQNYIKKRQLKDELPQEIKAARRQMDEAFEFMKEKKDDECEMFGRLLASKLKKIRNPNTRDILMNDIQNLLFRACMADRLEQQSAVPQFSTSQSPHHQAYSPSPNYLSYQSPLGLSTSPSPHHQANSPPPNSLSYQSPLGLSTSPSPHHQANSPPPNPPSYQSPLSHDTNPPLDQFSVETSQENFLELPPPTRASQIVITDSGEIKIIKDLKFM